MNTLGLISIIFALIALVYAVYKGVSPLVAAPIAAIIIAAFNSIGMTEGYSKIYMSGIGGFVTNNFPIYLWGAIVGQFYNVSGGAKSIALWISKYFRGKDNQLSPLASILIIFIAGTIMSYGGISGIVLMFVLMPLTLEVMKASNIPHYMAPGILLGSIATAALSMPGSPQIQNSAPPIYLNTSSTAALIPGLIGGVVVLGLNIIYLNWAAKKEIAKGNVYAEVELVSNNSKSGDEETNLPSPMISLIPLIITFALYNFAKLYIGFSIMAGIVASIICFWPQISTPKEVIKVFEKSAVTSAHICFASASLAGFGSVVSATETFTDFATTLTSINGEPLLIAMLAIMLITGITGSGPAGIGASLPMFKDTFAAMGINMSALHRVAAFSATSFDTLPTNAGYIAATNLARAETKQSYKYVGVCTVVNTTIATCVVTVLLILFPNLA